MAPAIPHQLASKALGPVQRLVELLNGAPAPPRVDAASRLHPLDPLTPDEIQTAARACRELAAAKGRAPLRFNAISLQEPAKADYLRFCADASFALPRVALCVLQPPGGGVIEALVAVSDIPPTVLAWEEVPGAQPMCTIDDALEAEAIILADARVAELVRQRYGVTDVQRQLVADPWYYGARNEAQEEAGGRLMSAFLYLRDGALDNHYAHPLDLYVFVDMAAKRVLHDRSFMHAQAPKIPALCSNFVHERSAAEVGVRTGLKPLNISQPEGPSFSVDGNHVRWQKWDFRVGFNYREGLVLHDLKYEDDGRLRPIMHRFSLVEIVVPYGDPRRPYNAKCAFDVVDYGMGNCCSSLELGCDCLGAIKYFDGVLCDKDGAPLVIKKAVCVHEEDTGIAWKHAEYRGDGRNDVRRGRRLVLQFVATVANYDYVFAIYLQTDGGIQYEAKLTGCLSTSILSEGEGPQPTNGALMAPGLNAQIHQHFFCVRMDPAIDCPRGGEALTVTEVNVEPMPPGPDNPYAIGFKHSETPLRTERGAIRDVDPAASRVWKLCNLAVRNPMSGAPVAFKLVPHASPPMYALPQSSHASRGAFATHALWVTPHSEAERWPAGMHPYAPGRNHGLAEWTAQDRPVEGADVVVWHSFGVTHVPRTEDWPVMPVETVGFHLKPANFFSVNPALDLPPGPVGTNTEVCCAGVGGPSQASRL